MKSTLRILLCLTLLPLLLGCTGHRRYAALLDEAEQANRVGRSLPSETQMLEVARHYDRPFHSANNRMRAYYLLGCVYRDRGEAPAALHYYNTATERADTLSKDCDYATLFRVYGQMALMYERQNMPQEELEAWERCVRNSYLAGDTLSAILGIARKTVPYYMLDDTVQVIATTKEAYRLYMQCGEKAEAARVLPTAIYTTLSHGDYSRGRRYIDLFESQSQLFDDEGNIEEGREIYYDSKGLYYLGVHNVDSAEYFYRKLLMSGYLYEGYKGLLAVYRLRTDGDSIIKYSDLHEKALLEWQAQQQADAVIQSSALYNYERHQNIAREKTQEAKLAWTFGFFSIILLVMAAVIGVMAYKRYKEKKKQQEDEYRTLSARYEEAQRKMQRQRDELVFLHKNHETLQQISTEETAKMKEENSRILAQKQEEIKDQCRLIQELQSVLSSRENALLHDDVILLSQAVADGRYNGRKISKRDWENLFRKYKKHEPYNYSKMQECRLTHQEMQVSILTHIGISTKSISILLGNSLPAVSKAKTHANQKLYGQGGALDLYKNIRKVRHDSSDM